MTHYVLIYITNSYKNNCFPHLQQNKLLRRVSLLYYFCRSLSCLPQETTARLSYLLLQWVCCDSFFEWCRWSRYKFLQIYFLLKAYILSLMTNTVTFFFLWSCTITWLLRKRLPNIKGWMTIFHLSVLLSSDNGYPWKKCSSHHLISQLFFLEKATVLWYVQWMVCILPTSVHRIKRCVLRGRYLINNSFSASSMAFLNITGILFYSWVCSSEE